MLRFMLTMNGETQPKSKFKYFLILDFFLDLLSKINQSFGWFSNYKMISIMNMIRGKIGFNKPFYFSFQENIQSCLVFWTSCSRGFLNSFTLNIIFFKNRFLNKFILKKLEVYVFFKDICQMCSGSNN